MPEEPPAPPTVTIEVSAPLERDTSFRRGVALGLFVHEKDPDARRFYYEQFLDEIVEVGATDIALVVRWAQRDVAATMIRPVKGVTVQDDVLREVMALSVARGLRVFVLPTLHVERRRWGQWRGALRPSDWEEWWLAYRRFILHYAGIAQEGGAVMFAVGSELVSTERYETRWRALIGEVRTVFSGALTYSANWDHFEPVQFWDAVDVVGISAYPELSDEDQPGLEALVQGWGPFRRRLRGWAAAHGHRYVFTEVGFPSHTDAARRPWDYGRKAPVDLDLQLRCYESLYHVWQRDVRLDGLYLWNWYGVGGAGDGGYTPRGKPAQDVVRHWYRRSVAVPSRSD